MIDKPFHDAATSKPREYTAVSVWLADGNFETATWTGRRWWTLEGIAEVVRWLELPGAY